MLAEWLRKGYERIYAMWIWHAQHAHIGSWKSNGHVSLGVNTNTQYSVLLFPCLNRSKIVIFFCLFCKISFEFNLFLYARLQTGRIMVWWCPSVRVSVRPSVRLSQFSALFSYMLWHIDLKFCVSLYFYARKIKFECHQFPSLFAGVMLLFNFKLLQICSFPHFSPTCFDILSSNFVYDFVLMYHRASLSVVIFLQFLLELCLFVNLEYSKYTVFRTFLLHALTYWAEILHMTYFYCTTD